MHTEQCLVKDDLEDSDFQNFGDQNDNLRVKYSQNKSSKKFERMLDPNELGRRLVFLPNTTLFGAWNILMSLMSI